MHLRHAWRLLLWVGLFVGLVGCENREAPLGVRGTVTITGGDMNSGFSFPTETLLYDERTAPSGATWGYCDIRVQGGGRPDIVAVGVARGTAGDGGASSDRMFRARFDDPRPTSLQAYAEVAISGRVVRVDAGSSCSLEITAYDVQARVAQVRSTCTATDQGRAVQIAADLTFVRCHVQGT